MNPNAIVPAIAAADPFAGPAWLVHALLVLTSVLHVLAMNLLLGGTLTALVRAVLVAVRRRDPPRSGGANFARICRRSWILMA